MSHDRALCADLVYVPEGAQAKVSYIKSCLFSFNDTATTEIYTLSLHDALPIYVRLIQQTEADAWEKLLAEWEVADIDRKSTRLNSSHLVISYAVFCLKKKK